MPEIHEFSMFGDSKVGLLGIAELDNFPFKPVRFFWITDTPLDVTRGEHAHKECHQFIICLAGEYQISLNHGLDKTSFVLHKGYGLHIAPGIWGSQTPTLDGSLLGVFASLPYAEEDYMRDFNEYLDWFG
jgi:hypothetical protein